MFGGKIQICIKKNISFGKLKMRHFSNHCGNALRTLLRKRVMLLTPEILVEKQNGASAAKAAFTFHTRRSILLLVFGKQKIVEARTY